MATTKKKPAAAAKKMKKRPAAAAKKKKKKPSAAKKKPAAKKLVAKKPAAAVKPPAKDYPRRDDYGAGIDGYLATLSPEHRVIVEAVRRIVREAAPSADEALKWGMPVYSQGGMICYLRAFSKHVSFGFYDLAGLSDPDGLLHGTGRGGHVKLTSPADVQPDLFARWVKQAAIQNAAG